MPLESSQQSFLHLRSKHPEFIYHGHSVLHSDGDIKLHWEFELVPGIFFRPTMHFHAPKGKAFRELDPATLEHLCFHIGMIELISYWKLACPPRIIIKPYNLPIEAISFWQSTYYLGLGEFRHLNNIELTMADFFCLEFKGDPLPIMQGKMDINRVLLPVGGGKDSAISMWIMRNMQPEMEVIPFMVNTDPASLRNIKACGLDASMSLRVTRNIDPKLLTLNSQGYLNGHTPFSALLAFTAHMAANLIGSHEIMLSNESSANESTIPGTDINHQYSKTLQFEQAFREYLSKVCHSPVQYFSLLRPVNELQIASMFSILPEFHTVFRSCNVGSKKDIWCGSCAKCLFTSIMLSAFLDDDALNRIMGRDVLDDINLSHILNDLAGWSDQKPFECVGTMEEVKTALAMAIQTRQGKPMAALLAYAASHEEIRGITSGKTLMWSTEEKNFVPGKYLNSLNTLLIKSINHHFGS